MSSDEDVPDDSDNEELPGGDEGEWIGGEFFSAKRQKRRHQTKEVRVCRESLRRESLRRVAVLATDVGHVLCVSPGANIRRLRGV
jgi:hypothetical protein